MEFTVEQFLFNTPLYERIEVTEENKEEIGLLFNISSRRRDYEGFNPIDKIETTFKNKDSSYHGYSIEEINHDYHIFTIECKRTNREFQFYIRINKDTSSSTIWIMKIGQYPSLADFQLQELKEYNERILPKEQAREFSKAIGLAAHGIGIGSFVYLRRVFEYLIYSTYENKEDALGISKVDFTRLRMDEKINKLKDYLPQSLVNNKHVYSILSKGIHELEEDQCTEYFTVLKESIEIILDELLEAENKEKRKIKIERETQKIHQRESRK